MPMHVYRVVQTGANKRSGGVQDGKEILRYHPPGFVDFTTKGVPNTPPVTCPTTDHASVPEGVNCNCVVLLLLVVCGMVVAKGLGGSTSETDDGM